MLHAAACVCHLLQAAERDYSTCLALSQEVGLTGPYILNARGNTRNSLGKWEGRLRHRGAYWRTSIWAIVYPPVT
eukprot:scaffold125458_cov26-Prasinocladus_malaysianus.AAC.1